MTLLVAIAFIFILGSAVILHEFGHFIVAKLFKIRVETFSVGFGPRLFGKKFGDTDYRVSAIPLGGSSNLAATNRTRRSKAKVRPTFQRVSALICDRDGNVS